MSDVVLREFGITRGRWDDSRRGFAIPLPDAAVNEVIALGCAGIYACVHNDDGARDPALAHSVFLSVRESLAGNEIPRDAVIACNCAEGSYCTWHNKISTTKDGSSFFGYYGCPGISVVAEKSHIALDESHANDADSVGDGFGATVTITAHDNASDEPGPTAPPLAGFMFPPNDDWPTMHHRPFDKREIMARLFDARRALQRASTIVDDALLYMTADGYAETRKRPAKKRSAAKQKRKTTAKSSRSAARARA